MKKSFCIKMEVGLANKFRQEAIKRGMSHEALFRNIFYFWLNTSEEIALLNRDLLSGKRKIVDGDK